MTGTRGLNERARLIALSSSRLVTLAAWGLIGAGVALRLRQYLSNRSLWLDEAMLALNIIHKDVWGLLGKLDYDQGAPLGFLLLEKLAVTLLGDGERALRLLPLLAGCAALVLFFLLARRMLSWPGLLTALALAAFSPMLVYYSSEVKQYATDVFVTLLLFYLFASRNLLAFPRLSVSLSAFSSTPSPASILPFLLLHSAFLLAPWFSHPAVFVLAATGLTLLWQHRRHPLPVLVIGVVWLTNIGALYLLNLRGLAENDFLRAYWEEYFRQNPLTALLGLFENPAGLTTFPVVLLLAAALGVVFLLSRTGGAMPLLLVFPLLLAASWLGLYPFAGRMILFLVPLVYLFVAAAVSWLWQWSPRPRLLAPMLALVLASISLSAPAALSIERFLHPKYPEHIRPAMAYLNAHYQPGDALYVYYWALPAFRYYAPASLPYLAGGLHANPHDLLAELDSLRGRPRVWFLFSHVYERGEYNERDWMLAYLDEVGKRRRQFIEPGTSVYLYLYDLR